MNACQMEGGKGENRQLHIQRWTLGRQRGFENSKLFIKWVLEDVEDILKPENKQ